ncbi:GNAT family N-acetyltransferase [Hyphomonas sp. WL0036]|uniref:GNAT family N-acetyltransferase n=1 Tax=Hyphomonas sediminis TaxID=2866160 RepID=UPI001C821496|nr:GNAT family N-acetyltransferase [Hyphomonas sediminis]MBY9067890.1 GNAT family N-acetyltransferase [Hyphomonas sediminis]
MQTDTTFRIVPMTGAHLASVVKVQAEAFTPDLLETPAVFADRLARFGEHFRVALMADRTVGYLVCFPWKLGDTPVNNENFPETLPDPDCFYIHDMALLPEARGSGLARAMLEDAYAQADRMGFDAVSLVAVGQSGSYWDKMGYVPYTAVSPAKLQRILDIYGPGARLMARPI